MRDKIFSFSCIVVIISVMLFAPMKKILCETGIMSEDNVGNIISADEKYSADSRIGKILNGIERAKASVDDIYINYLPYYNSVVVEAKGIDQSINEPFTSYLLSLGEKRATPAETAGDDVTVIPDEEIDDGKPHEISHEYAYLNATDTHRNYLVTVKYSDGTESAFLDRVMSRSHSELEEILENSITEFNRIVSYKSDEVNYYMYAGTRFQDTELLEEYIPAEQSTYNHLMHIFDSLPDHVRCDWLKFETIEDRLELVYTTDHHWTASGTDVGYHEILDMMRLDTPDIGEPRKGILHVLSDCIMNGSFSRLASYYKISDDFEFIDYGLPEHIVSGGQTYEEMSKIYLSGGYDKVNGAGHYEMFYPWLSKLEYPENKTGRNLLIIGDSFARSIGEVLASHFDTTYVSMSNINMRLYIDRLNVTDVLILMYTDRMMYQVYNELNLKSIRTGGA